MLNKYILLILTLIININLGICEVIDVTKTSILVNDTNGNDTLKMKQAFAQIIANNTGENILNILKNPIFNQTNIKSQIKRSYFEKIDSKYLTDKTNPKYWYNIVVDESSIRKITQDAGLSLLPLNRKKMMLWAVVEDLQEKSLNNLNIDGQVLNLDENELPYDSSYLNESQNDLIYAYEDEVLMYWAQRWATALGMVLELPTIDELDMLAVTPQSIKSLSFEAHNQSHSRYQLNQSILLYAKRTEEGTKIRSGYVSDDSEVAINHFQSELVEEGEILYSSMREAAELYANQFKIKFIDVEEHGIRMVINSINDFDDITTIEKYLNNISVIKSFEIVSASIGKLVLNVDLRVTTPSFLSIIEHDGIFINEPNMSLNQLYFQYIKI